MSRIATVAWREFKQTVFRPVFIIAVLGIPILMVAVMAIAVVMIVKNKQPALVGTIAIVDPTGEVAEAATIEFSKDKLDEDLAEQTEEAIRQAQEQMEGGGSGSPMGMGSPPPTLARGVVNITVEAHSAGEGITEQSLMDRVRDGKLIAAAIVPTEVIDLPGGGEGTNARFTLHVGENLDSDHLSLIERRIGQAVVRVRAAKANLDPDEAMAMLRRPESSASRISDKGEIIDAGEGARVLKELLPVVFMLLLWISVFTSGQHLLMSTIEEKSNRVMEVLLSAVSPFQLMTGKILGHCGVGLLIASLYLCVVVAGFAVGARFDSAFRNAIEVMDIVSFGAFFFMAYFMIASLMAAVGSAVSDLREANTLVTPVMLVLMVPWLLWQPISQAPNGNLATAFSFIPPASPFAMIIRISAEEPIPMWQLPATIIWGYICVLAMVWMAAKIFRIGVLMYGKPPSLFELAKWLRYS